MLRTTLGLAAAVVTSTVVSVALVAAALSAAAFPADDRNWYLGLTAWVFGAISVIAIPMLGIPMHVVLRNHRLSNARNYVFAGLIVSTSISSVLFLVILPTMLPEPEFVNYLAPSTPTIITWIVGIICGPAAAFSYWFTARPDHKTTQIDV